MLYPTFPWEQQHHHPFLDIGPVAEDRPAWHLDLSFTSFLLPVIALTTIDNKLHYFTSYIGIARDRLSLNIQGFSAADGSVTFPRSDSFETLKYLDKLETPPFY